MVCYVRAVEYAFSAYFDPAYVVNLSGKYRNFSAYHLFVCLSVGKLCYWYRTVQGKGRMRGGRYNERL